MPTDPKLSIAQHDEALRRWAYWLMPAVFCLALYCYGLRAWYQQDDFVWLGQRYNIHSLQDFLRAVFAPSQHGTFRPLSERLFFLIFGGVFGIDAFPARLCVFLTQLANLALLSSIARRLSGSRVAGFLAPVLWTANAALSFPMAWTSAYMEILCGFCLLLAFYCFLRYIETVRRVWYYGQWAAFLVGFGVMESMIVYPAIAAAYALFCARHYLRRTLPFFGASILFYAFHSLFVPKQHTGVYTIHFDASIARTLAIYWKWVLVPANWAEGWTFLAGLAPVLAVALSAAVLAYVAYSVWRRSLLPLFGLTCFALLLAPMAPLKEHMSYYYLTLPAIGIALVGAFAAADAARKGWSRKTITAATLLLFLMVQAPCTAYRCKWWYQRSQRIKSAVLGAVAERQAFPGKTIVLTDVDEALFYSGFWYGAFRAFGVPDAYVDPADSDKIRPDPILGDTSRLFLDPADLRQGLIEHRVKVLSAANSILVDVTPRFEVVAKASGPVVAPRRVDVGSERSQPYLRGTWYALESEHRWMGKSAGVILAGPNSPAAELRLGGYCPGAQVAAGPLTGKVTADGQLIGELSLSQGDSSFEAVFRLPPGTIGKPSIEIGVRLDRTFRAPGDIRDLGLSFGSFEVR